ncbi:hypothetical protein LPTSP3_g37590 [Leptospira kobayashii]|uniref:Lipoprotein n=1 Tax=Leptospira kobayashii TaxID=1917830 RepID=A0ABM7UNV6_9LEPT|nr:hypothetical protein [Leptospira kobayashii]BDA80829.1 hypothetical protein LPTSP3_g37590 [Leptospira kobayashii]
MKTSSKLFFLLLVFCFVSLSYCKTSALRLPDPGSEAEVQTQTVYGFAIFKVRKNLISEHPFPLHGKDLVFSSPTNLVDTNFAFPSTALDSYHVLLGKSKQSYILSEIGWTEVCGNNCVLKFHANLNPNESQSALPLEGKPGEIRFLGVYYLHLSPQGKLKNEFQGKLEEGYSQFADDSLESFKEHLFENPQDISPKSAEIKFLKSFIRLQKEGYWKDKAEEKLNSITK